MDFITQNRQNYLYYHLKEVIFLVRSSLRFFIQSDFVSVEKNGHLKRVLKNGQNWEKFESQREKEWDIHTKKLRLELVSKICFFKFKRAS